MTGRTHDLAAITLAHGALVYAGFPQMTLGTCALASIATLIGAMIPDLDQPVAKLWRRIPILGGVIGRVASLMLGGHRIITHSLVGMAGIGILLKVILEYMQTFVLVDMQVVWSAAMLGMLSHLITDSLTREGVPWLFPIPLRFGFPPVRALRLTTGGMIERGAIFPLLVVTNIYWIYMYYGSYLVFFKHLR